ncbi:hypothetical protein FACS1894211_06190 [Clostridia bacterium]|nr:hypothetical protein FACS1894211_06190 [Clostridia bacterium]
MRKNKRKLRIERNGAELALDRLFTKLGMGLRSKLITIFLIVKVIPIILIAVIAWRQFSLLGSALADRTHILGNNLNAALSEVGDHAVADSKTALIDSAREQVDRLSTDTASKIASFLYRRDDDIKFLATLDPTAGSYADVAETYKNFIVNQRSALLRPGDWDLGYDEKNDPQHKTEIWVPVNRTDPAPDTVTSSNPNNEIDADGELGHSGEFHYRAPDGFRYESRPLYDEIAFIDTSGVEQIKLVWGDTYRAIDGNNQPFYNSDLYVNGSRNVVLGMGTTKIGGDVFGPQIWNNRFNPQLTDLSAKNLYGNYQNTYMQAEKEFMDSLPSLKNGEIFVSDVIGAYVGTNYIGMYTPGVLNSSVIDAHPNKDMLRGEAADLQNFMQYAQNQAYAGAENPYGQRFQGIVRWATPVFDAAGTTLKGYVTFALNHDHIMEFTDHITPLAERYVELPNAYAGNYAFIWDYQCRSIAHPRHHSIVGYDRNTGDPQVPWLEGTAVNGELAAGSPYQLWYDHGGKEWLADLPPYTNASEPVWKTAIIPSQGVSWGAYPNANSLTIPQFDNQSRQKTAARELTRLGFVGLDGRYLNHAPQCTGWMDLTEKGGSGSFYILWSGLWKPTAAAAIPYYTGHYAPSEQNGSRRGFGIVTVCAGMDDFKKPAEVMAGTLNGLIGNASEDLAVNTDNTQAAIRKNLNSTTWQLFLIALFFVTLVILVAVWLASYLSRNILQLNRGMARFRSGERQFRFNALVKDEFGQLADSFDEMADSLVDSVKPPLSILDTEHRIVYMNEEGLAFSGKTLDEIVGKPYRDYSAYPQNTVYDPILALEENREAEIYHMERKDIYIKGQASYFYDKDGRKLGYIVTSVDVTEMRKTQTDLERAVLSANLANEHKGEFLARMSHEIRTPMNAIMGITSLLDRKLSEMRGGKALGEAKEYVKQIDNSSSHLLNLLNDILDLSKIDAGKIDMVEETVDLSELAETVKDIIMPRCTAKGIVFDAKFDAFDTAFLTDSLRLRQVLINLLGNAVKFTPELGRVEFVIEKKGREDGKTLVRFTVRDNGIGMEETVLSNLFKPFEQGDRNISRKYGGTGLGLAISGRIVELLGGKIGVESAPGRGSEFAFEIWLKETARAAGEGTPAAADAEGKFVGKRVLLVDDVDINRMIVSSLLEPTGVSIDEAADGAEALKRFTESAPGTYDMILMDIQMPVMDGYQASVAIRSLKRPDAERIPIVALTANAFKDDIDRAIKAGMDAHIAKPVEYDKLVEMLFRFLR